MAQRHLEIGSMEPCILSILWVLCCVKVLFLRTDMPDNRNRGNFAENSKELTWTMSVFIIQRQCRKFHTTYHMTGHYNNNLWCIWLYRVSLGSCMNWTCLLKVPTNKLVIEVMSSSLKENMEKGENKMWKSRILHTHVFISGVSDIQQNTTQRIFCLQD